jgi:hypothetical protein
MKLNRFSTFVAGTLVVAFFWDIAAGRQFAASVDAAFLAYYAVMFIAEFWQSRSARRPL